MKVKSFLMDMLRGAAIGIAMIIPGISGGTLAVVMNIYNKLIDAISNLRRDFKNSFKFLLPILLGAIIAVAAVYFPLKIALDKAPFPTVMLFLGLMVGSCPNIIKNGISKGIAPVNIASILIPLLVVIGVCFIPGTGDANLSSTMPVYGYFLLLLVGATASCALVVPGISGSMLLLVFGYYNSIINVVSDLAHTTWHSVLVLVLFLIGIIIGFFSIAKLMKFLLSKFPRGTNWAIIGFFLGSIPAIFISYNDNFPSHPFISLDAVHISVGIILCVAGIIGAYALTAFLEARHKKLVENQTTIVQNETV